MGGAVFAESRRKRVDVLVDLDRTETLAKYRDTGSFLRVRDNPLHRAWNAMVKRCNDPLTRGYQHYGERGISVCLDWDDGCSTGYEEFAAWVLLNIGPKPSRKHSLDRVDPDGDYEPGNIRWATWKEQRANKRAEHDPERDAQRGPLKMRALAVFAGVLRHDGELPDDPGADDGSAELGL